MGKGTKQIREAAVPRLPLIMACAVAAAALFFTLEGLLRAPGEYDSILVGEGGKFGLRGLKLFGIPAMEAVRIAMVGIFIWICMRWRPIRGIGGKTALKAMGLSLVMGVAGFKVLSIAENLLFRDGFTLGGYSLFGAMFILPLVSPLMVRVLKLDRDQLLDWIAVALCYGICFQRLGCFMGGCCGGRAWYPGGRSFPFIPPVQLYEDVWDWLILFFLLFMDVRVPERGLMFPLYMLAYSAFRFPLEYLRDEPLSILGLTSGQFCSLLCIALALCMLALRRERMKTIFSRRGKKL